MRSKLSLSNLPPGVTDSMIPGNRPEDIEWEKFHEHIDNTSMVNDYGPEEAMFVWEMGMRIFNFIRSKDKKFYPNMNQG